MDVGAHLKSVRQMYGLSQRELAKRAGVTKNGLISLIEQNRVSPSVSSSGRRCWTASRWRSAADFFTLDLAGQARQVFFPRRGTGLISGQGAVVAAFGRWPAGKRSMSILTSDMPANADTGEEMLTHAGEEGGVVVKGRIELSVGGDSRILGAGGCVLFQEFDSAPVSQSRARRVRDRERELAAHVLDRFTKERTPLA